MGWILFRSCQVERRCSKYRGIVGRLYKLGEQHCSGSRNSGDGWGGYKFINLLCQDCARQCMRLVLLLIIMLSRFPPKIEYLNILKLTSNEPEN